MYRNLRRVFFIFIAISAFCLIVALVYQYSVKNRTINKITPNKKTSAISEYPPTPTQYLERSDDWRIYNYGSPDKLISFSYEIPFVGTYCNGCFDGTPACPDNSGEFKCGISTISGGYFDGTGPRTWLIVQEVLDENNNHIKGSSWRVPPGNFINKLFSLKIGESLIYSSTGEEKLTYNLKSIRNINNIPFYILDSDSNSGFDLKNQKIMLFKYKVKIIFISFEYNNQLYSNAFEHILNTFQFTLRENNDYGTTVEEFNLPIPTEDPRFNNITLHPPEN